MLIPVRIGVPSIALSVEDPTVSLPSMAGVVPTVTAVNGYDSGSIQLDSLRTAMDVATNYQFMVGLVGHASNRKGGYTVTRCSEATGIAQLSANQAFKISIPSGSLPNLYDRAVCAVVFSRKGSSSLWKLQDFAYIESGVDLVTVVGTDPLANADAFDVAVLQSTTSDPVLGLRDPIGVLDYNITLTQGGVVVNREVTSFNVDADQIPAFPISTARAANIQFNTLANGIKEVTKAVGGEYYQVAHGASSLEIARATIATAFAVLRGNRRIKLVMPNDSGKAGEIRVYIGNLFISPVAISESWQKAATTPIPFQLSTAPQDNLLFNNFTELSYRRNT